MKIEISKEDAKIIKSLLVELFHYMQEDKKEVILRVTSAIDKANERGE